MVVQKGRRYRLRIGLDFDGVVAYNPFRVVRAPIKWFKREVLGITTLRFFVPKNWWQRMLWTVVHESSIWPATGAELLKTMAQDERYEFHLITARFGFLKKNLYDWLERNRLKSVFRSINVNDDYEQPHEYKLRIVKRLGLDYYVEDNLDIVMHLRDKVGARVYWIYNITDAGHPYPNKYPYLEKALMEIPK